MEKLVCDKLATIPAEQWVLDYAGPRRDMYYSDWQETVISASTAKGSRCRVKRLHVSWTEDCGGEGWRSDYEVYVDDEMLYSRDEQGTNCYNEESLLAKTIGRTISHLEYVYHQEKKQEARRKCAEEDRQREEKHQRLLDKF